MTVFFSFFLRDFVPSCLIGLCLQLEGIYDIRSSLGEICVLR